jgi:hypothetical protein
VNATKTNAPINIAKFFFIYSTLLFIGKFTQSYSNNHHSGEKKSQEEEKKWIKRNKFRLLDVGYKKKYYLWAFLNIIKT